MTNKKLWMRSCVCLLVLLGGCAASHSSNSPSITPSAAALAPGQSVQFQATLPGNPKPSRGPSTASPGKRNVGNH